MAEEKKQPSVVGLSNNAAASSGFVGGSLAALVLGVLKQKYQIELAPGLEAHAAVVCGAVVAYFTRKG